MTATLGAIACVIAVACGIGFGFNLRAWTAGLQTAYNPTIVCAAYLAATLAGVVTVGVCLGVVG